MNQKHFLCESESADSFVHLLDCKHSKSVCLLCKRETDSRKERKRVKINIHIGIIRSVKSLETSAFEVRDHSLDYPDVGLGNVMVSALSSEVLSRFLPLQVIVIGTESFELSVPNGSHLHHEISTILTLLSIPLWFLANKGVTLVLVLSLGEM